MRTVQDHNVTLDLVEALIDETSLEYVLDVVAEIASTKADHILITYQDQVLADDWDKCAASILAASCIAKEYLP